jgi:glycine cleavage system transcriptional repressor
MERENLILTAVGPDRVGLVETISEFILRYGCNIEDSKMAVFCGEFAIILLVSGAADKLRQLANHQYELAARSGLNVYAKIPSRRRPQEKRRLYTLKASCLDHPGVVYRVSGALSRLGINIESMETKTDPAPETGTAIFRLEALLSVPEPLEIRTVEARLDEIAREEKIDLELSALTPLPSCPAAGS